MRMGGGRAVWRVDGLGAAASDLVLRGLRAQGRERGALRLLLGLMLERV